jgi:hypothetical protein
MFLFNRLALLGWRRRVLPALSRRLWAFLQAFSLSSGVEASRTLRMAVRRRLILERFLAFLSASVRLRFIDCLLLAKRELLSQY